MPDGGMWNMRQGTFTNFPGDPGGDIHYCFDPIPVSDIDGDDYSSMHRRCPGSRDREAHLVHIDGFVKGDCYCREGRVYTNSISNPKSNAVISLTEKYIPSKIRRKHPHRIEMGKIAKDVYLGNMEESDLEEFIRSAVLNTSPAQECIDWVEHRERKKPKKSNIATFFYPPEHEKALKDAGRSAESAIKARKAQKVDGFIYTATHPSWPEIKIGFTFNPPSRLSTFNTCCPHKLFCMPYISTYLRNAKAGEDEVHKTLDGFRAEGEWFNISLELAVSTIKDYVESLDDTEK